MYIGKVLLPGIRISATHIFLLVSFMKCYIKKNARFLLMRFHFFFLFVLNITKTLYITGRYPTLMEVYYIRLHILLYFTRSGLFCFLLYLILLYKKDTYNTTIVVTLRIVMLRYVYLLYYMFVSNA